MFKHFLYFIACLILCCCSESNKDVVNYIKNIKARPIKKIEPLPQFVSMPSVTQTSFNRDPFVANTSEKKHQSLSSFPIKSLKFVGTLQQGKKIWALIEQPNRHIQAVESGVYIGNSHDRILVIKKNLMQLQTTDGEQEHLMTWYLMSKLKQ